MAEQTRHPDDGDLAATLRLLHREVEFLRRALSRGEERADSVVQKFITLQNSIASKCEVPINGASASPPKPRAPTESTLLLKLAAQSGVDKLEFEWLADGAALVRVDGGKLFQLSPALAGLLEALALHTANDGGDLVGWKSLSAISAHLETRIGRPCSPHAIHQLVSRLRSALAVGGGVNPFLVQTDRHLGWRFALRERSRA